MGSLLGSSEVASDGSLRHAEFLGNLFAWYAKHVLHLCYCFSLFKGRSLSVQRHWRDAAECSRAVDVFGRDWAAAVFAAPFSPLEPGVLLCLLYPVSVVEEHWRRVLVVWVVGRPVAMPRNSRIVLSVHPLDFRPEMLMRPDSPGLKFMLLGNSGVAGFLR